MESGSHWRWARPASKGDRDEQQLSAYFESLPRHTMECGSFTPDEVAEVIRVDRNAVTVSAHH